MLRLFPKSWFRRAATRARSELVEAQQATWHSRMTDGLARVVAPHSGISLDAVEALQALDAAHLLALDQVLRYGFGHTYEVEPDRAVPNLTPLGRARPETDAYLFVMACDANGFIRERALDTFRHYPGRLALAVALIRCDDWVPQVRDAAFRLLDRMIDEELGGEMFGFIDLLLVLSRRERFSEGVWRDRIERVLCAPKAAERRWQATEQGSFRARSFALQLVLRADPERANAALGRAVDDGHPALAQWALEQSTIWLSEEEIRDLLNRASRHPHGRVRSESLRRRCVGRSEESLASLSAALFDPARSPRNAAAHLLRTNFDRSALSSWRNALDAQRLRQIPIALAALSEHAEPEDVARLMPYLTDVSPQLRILALRGLAQARAPELMQWLERALADRSPRVIRQAVLLIARSGHPLNPVTLMDAYKNASSARSRAVLARATGLLGKWDTLGALLSAVASAADEDMPLIERELDRWLMSSVSRFTPLVASVRSVLVARLTVARAKHAFRAWREIESDLEAR